MATTTSIHPTQSANNPKPEGRNDLDSDVLVQNKKTKQNLFLLFFFFCCCRLYELKPLLLQPGARDEGKRSTYFWSCDAQFDFDLFPVMWC